MSNDVLVVLLVAALVLPLMVALVTHIVMDNNPAAPVILKIAIVLVLAVTLVFLWSIAIAGYDRFYSPDPSGSGDYGWYFWGAAACTIGSVVWVAIKFDIID